MKKLPSIFITLLIAAIILFVAGLILLPDQMESLWRQADLPEASLSQIKTLTGHAAEPQEARLYGTLEAHVTHVMSEINGRAVRVLVEEGETVAAGQPLVYLDPSDTQAQIAAAEEAVAASRAARDATAAPPDETIAALAQETVNAARTEVANARRDLEQAQDMLANPLALDAQIDQTAAMIPVAQAGIDAAKASVKQIQVLIDDAQKDGSREGKYKVRILQEQKAAAEEEQNAVQARLNGLHRTLALLKKMREVPLALEANVHQAEDQVRLAKMALAVAEAERDAKTAPPQPEAVAVADADVQKAQAALNLARWQEQRLIITAPISGRVQAKLLETGEIAQPGQPLLDIANTDSIEVWAYISQQDLHRVHLNDRLPVEVIAIPGEQFQGRVFFIAPQAQFRPNNVLNPDDRGDIVFQIKLSLDNSDGRLKPGMPADVILLHK